jgi:hypothetical protein
MDLLLIITIFISGALLRDFEQGLEIDPQSVEARVGVALVLLECFSGGWSESERCGLCRL